MSWAMRKENWDLIRNATRNINTRNTTVSLDESGVGVGASGLSQTGHHLGATIEAWSYCKLYVCGSLTASWRERQRESIYEQKDERESFYWEREMWSWMMLFCPIAESICFYTAHERGGGREEEVEREEEEDALSGRAPTLFWKTGRGFHEMEAPKTVFHQKIWKERAKESWSGEGVSHLTANWFHYWTLCAIRTNDSCSHVNWQ